MEPKSEPNKISIPMAIIVAGVLVAGAVYFSSIKQEAIESNQGPKKDTVSLENMRAVSSAEHIRGNVNAPVKIVEYSDIECPFCKIFHATMQKVMDEYGKNGKVAWIYRHFPIDSRHPKARKEAQATECANELGGNDKFWAYLDRIYEITPSNNGLSLALLPEIAKYVGLNVVDFNICINSDKYLDRIEDDLQNANVTGGLGTPWSIIITKNGKKYPVNGAQPYENIKQMIDFALQ